MFKAWYCSFLFASFTSNKLVMASGVKFFFVRQSDGQPDVAVPLDVQGTFATALTVIQAALSCKGKVEVTFLYPVDGTDTQVVLSKLSFPLLRMASSSVLSVRQEAREEGSCPAATSSSQVGQDNTQASKGMTQRIKPRILSQLVRASGNLMFDGSQQMCVVHAITERDAPTYVNMLHAQICVSQWCRSVSDRIQQQIEQNPATFAVVPYFDHGPLRWQMDAGATTMSELPHRHTTNIATRVCAAIVLGASGVIFYCNSTQHNASEFLTEVMHDVARTKMHGPCSEIPVYIACDNVASLFSVVRDDYMHRKGTILMLDRGQHGRIRDDQTVDYDVDNSQADDDDDDAGDDADDAEDDEMLRDIDPSSTGSDLDPPVKSAKTNSRRIYETPTQQQDLRVNLLLHNMKLLDVKYGASTTTGKPRISARCTLCGERKTFWGAPITRAEAHQRVCKATLRKQSQLTDFMSIPSTVAARVGCSIADIRSFFDTGKVPPEGDVADPSL